MQGTAPSTRLWALALELQQVHVYEEMAKLMSRASIGGMVHEARGRWHQPGSWEAAPSPIIVAQVRKNSPLQSPGIDVH